MKDMHETLNNVFRIRYLMPYQEMVVSRILENSMRKEPSCAITIMPTGSGKSLCFMLPALMFEKRYTILLYPLLSLMNDQAGRFDALGVPYAVIRGGMDRQKRLENLRNLERLKCTILLTNMESLVVMDGRNELSFMRGKLELFVVDEAHTVPSWGLSFRPCYMELGRIIGNLAPHQCLAFTATLDKRDEACIRRMLFPSSRVQVLRASADRENIFYAASRTLNTGKDLIRILGRPGRLPALVFCAYRAETERTAALLAAHFKTMYYHAGLEKEERKAREKEFAASGDAVMCATCAYGMGVDARHIRTVIHLHIPTDARDYLQETGRGGRDGKNALAVLLYRHGDEGRLKKIFSDGGCIRRGLLEEMGEDGHFGGCTACGACCGFEPPSGERELVDAVRRCFLLHTPGSLAFLLRHGRGAPLRGWSGPEVLEAVKILLEEGTMKSFFNHLYIPRGK